MRTKPVAALWRLVMLRNLAFVVGYAVIQVLSTTASVGQLTSALQRKPKLCLREQWPR